MSSTQQSLSSFNTDVQFLSDIEVGSSTDMPVYYASSPGRDAAHDVDRGIKTQTISVEDARGNDDFTITAEFNQNTCGVNLVNHHSTVENFLDSAIIKTVYEPEIESLLKEVTGCYRVAIFDHTVRASDPDIRDVKNVREPSTLVHNDYTSNSGFTCLRENLGADAEKLKQGRFQIVNVWRPLVDPVENWPLAFCDTRSLETENLIDTIRKGRNHEGEIVLATHNQSQRWFYYSKMRPDEVLIFKTFDSIDNGYRPTTIHTAIELDVPEGTTPRESIGNPSIRFLRVIDDALLESFPSIFQN